MTLETEFGKVARRTSPKRANCYLVSKKRSKLRFGKLPFWERKSTADILAAAYGPVSVIFAWICAMATKEVRESIFIWILSAVAFVGLFFTPYIHRVWTKSESEDASDAWLKMASRIIAKALEAEYSEHHQAQTRVCISAYHVKTFEYIQLFEIGDSAPQLLRKIPKKCGAVGEAAETRSFVVGVR